MKKIFIWVFFLISNPSFSSQTNDVIGETKPKTEKTSHVMEAVYYGNKYNSKRHTANGDRFDMNAMTCAAPKRYAFGTKLKITNKENGKSVIVTVTDRGHFGEYKIDLTYGAFGKIAKHSRGKIKIDVEIVE